MGMVIVYKSQEQIDAMRQTGRVVRRIISKLMVHAQPGVTTFELDQLAGEMLSAAGAISTCRNYPTYKPGEGFPGYTCLSVNDVVLHGVPSPQALQIGDIVTLDVCVSLNGWCASAAITVPIGEVSRPVRHFLNTGAQALTDAVKQVKPNTDWAPIARMIQQSIEGAGYGVVREFVGHGIGRQSNELPLVPNFVGRGSSDFRLRPGMTFTIEPMLTMGKRDIEIAMDQWSIKTNDGLPGAHFRHTVAVTREGFEILTSNSSEL